VGAGLRPFVDPTAVGVAISRKVTLILLLVYRVLNLMVIRKEGDCKFPLMDIER